MIDRHYFEDVLPDQVRGFKRSVSVQVATDGGRTYEAYRLFAAHEHYVVLEVYPEYGAEPMRLPDGMGGESGQQPVIMDQVVLPYARISGVYFTARTEKPSSTKPVGFQVASEGAKKSK
jgi:hypothetical protein